MLRRRPGSVIQFCFSFWVVSGAPIIDTVTFHRVWGNRTILLAAFLSKQGEKRACKACHPNHRPPDPRADQGRSAVDDFFAMLLHMARGIPCIDH